MWNMSQVNDKNTRRASKGYPTSIEKSNYSTLNITCHNTGQRLFCELHLFFYKQLGSGLSLYSCLYFQGFWGSKLLIGFLVVWPSNLCRRGIHYRIQNRYLWSAVLKFSQKTLWDSWILVHCRFNSYFTLIAMEKLHSSLICRFYCSLVKGAEPWKLLSNFPSEG